MTYHTIIIIEYTRTNEKLIKKQNELILLRLVSLNYYFVVID
jgi:hypothetical protein